MSEFQYERVILSAKQEAKLWRVGFGTVLIFYWVRESSSAIRQAIQTTQYGALINTVWWAIIFISAGVIIIRSRVEYPCETTNKHGFPQIVPLEEKHQTKC